MKRPILAMVMMAACSAPAATTTLSEVTATTAASTTTAAPRTTTTAVATTTTTTAPTTTTTVAPVEQPAPVAFNGSGSDVIEFDSATADIISNGAVFSYEVSGSGNNVIWGLDEDFEQSDLLVNAIGTESGQQFLSIFEDGPVGVEIDAGSWEITISPILRVDPPSTLGDFYVPLLDTTGTYDPAMTRSIEVVGPAAVLLKTEQRTADITASGDGNIVIWAASAANLNVELLVNELDSFEGTVRLPDCGDGCFLDINEGSYAITIPE